MRELFKTGHVSEDELRDQLKMTDGRNLTVHTYHEEPAENLFKHLKTYVRLMRIVIERI